MIIGISLNEVLRDFLGQLAYTYEKYIDDIDITRDDVKSIDLIEYFKFDSVNELNNFLHIESALEIFGHADQMSDNLMTHFNSFLMDIEDEEEHEIIIVSREFSKSIPSTLFFLSKLGCRAKNIRFVTTYESIWDYVDVLISAHPTSLSAKPENKYTIKVKAPYNSESESDFELDSILPFLKDSEGVRNNILNKINE